MSREHRALVAMAPLRCSFLVTTLAASLATGAPVIAFELCECGSLAELLTAATLTQQQHYLAPRERAALAGDVSNYAII